QACPSRTRTTPGTRTRPASHGTPCGPDPRLQPAWPADAGSAGISYQELGDWFRLAHAGRRGMAAGEPLAGRPGRHLLVPAVGVIPDERDVADVDGEEVKPPGVGVPPKARRHRFGVAPLHRMVMLRPRGPADLELSFCSVAAADHAVHR